MVLNNDGPILQWVASGKSYATLTKGRGSGRPARKPSLSIAAEPGGLFPQPLPDCTSGRGLRTQIAIPFHVPWTHCAHNKEDSDDFRRNF
jgi:hypothetical protein